MQAAQWAVDNEARVKAALARLQDLPPCEDTVRWLTAGYRATTAAAWLTALLLGANGHRSGYPVAKEILLAGPGSLAEDYAASAMTMIDSKSALVDLAEICMQGETRLSNVAAATPPRRPRQEAKSTRSESACPV